MTGKLYPLRTRSIAVYTAIVAILLLDLLELTPRLGVDLVIDQSLL